MVFSEAQLRAVNGYGTHFWGWGREDDKCASAQLPTSAREHGVKLVLPPASCTV